jgi:hypothetical protein
VCVRGSVCVCGGWVGVCVCVEDRCMCMSVYVSAAYMLARCYRRPRSCGSSGRPPAQSSGRGRDRRGGRGEEVERRKVKCKHGDRGRGEADAHSGAETQTSVQLQAEEAD